MSPFKMHAVTRDSIFYAAARRTPRAARAPVRLRTKRRLQALFPKPVFGTEGKMRTLHTMLRVKNLDESIAFYCGLLGMELRRRTDYPGGEFTLAFVGYPGESHEIELTWNWDNREYEIGTGFGHLAIGVPDIRSVCDALRAAGAPITREPGPMKHGTTVIAFVRDPTGYAIELIERP